MPIAYGNSHTGRRERNEDAFCVMPHLGLFAVADGMGGQEGGEVASQLVVSSLVEFFEQVDRESPTESEQADDEDRLGRAIQRAHRSVVAHAEGALRQMGSTLAALLLRERHVVVAHVGDSRVYRLRDGALERLTTDHSLCAELEAYGGRAVDRFLRGQIGHLITRCIAANGPANADLRVDTVKPGDVYLLCSDGLTDVIADDEIGVVLRGCGPDEASKLLVERAYRKGSTDNITAVVVRIPG